jgi:hypothetical protein
MRGAVEELCGAVEELCGAVEELLGAVEELRGAVEVLRGAVEELRTATRCVRAGFGGEDGDALILLEEQDSVLNFLKAALKEDSGSGSVESDLLGPATGMLSSDSKLRLYSFLLVTDS